MPHGSGGFLDPRPSGGSHSVRPGSAAPSWALCFSGCLPGPASSPGHQPSAPAHPPVLAAGPSEATPGSRERREWRNLLSTEARGSAPQPPLPGPWWLPGPRGGGRFCTLPSPAGSGRGSSTAGPAPLGRKGHGFPALWGALTPWSGLQRFPRSPVRSEGSRQDHDRLTLTCNLHVSSLDLGVWALGEHSAPLPDAARRAPLLL